MKNSKGQQGYLRSLHRGYTLAGIGSSLNVVGAPVGVAVKQVLLSRIAWEKIASFF